jgi:ABC-type transport system involved in multi-copper enzyme maturation permease subunit
MSSILLALCWKEYRELKWNVLAMLAITLSMPLYALVRQPDTAIYWVLMSMAIYSMVGGICFGMWGAAGERANRSANLLHALPVSPRALGAIKLAIMIIAALIPLLAISLLGLVVKPLAETDLDRQANHWIFASICSVIVIHIALTTAIFGMGQRSELMAAGCGLLVLAVWGGCWMMAVALFAPTKVEGIGVIMFLGPPLYLLGSMGNFESIQWSFLPWFAVTGIVMLVLAATYVAKYAAAIRPLQSRANRRSGNWIPRQLSSPVASLIVKQVCETMPLVLLVLGIAFILSVGFATMGRLSRGSSEHWSVDVGMFFVVFAAFLGGFILALLLGVVAFAGDLEPRVNTFWRSRPISPSQWFWSKYFVALSSLASAIGIPALISFVLVEFSRTGAVIPPDETFLAILFIALGWFGIFSAAVVSTCLVRRPLHSGLLAFGLAAAGLGLAQWLDEGWFGAEPLKRPLLIAGVWIFASIAATLTAWWAAVRDVVVFE